MVENSEDTGMRSRESQRCRLRLPNNESCKMSPKTCLHCESDEIVSRNGENEQLQYKVNRMLVFI